MDAGFMTGIHASAAKLRPSALKATQLALLNY
jgi:hypothetical protein